MLGLTEERKSIHQKWLEVGSGSIKQDQRLGKVETKHST